MSQDFVHLHVHSDYSLLDGACQHDAMLDACKRFDMSSVALTDHGNLFGAMEFYLRARKKGVKPILGCELYVVPEDTPGSHIRGRSRSSPNHLLALCENLAGWQNLSKLCSLAYLEGFYYKPRVSKELLRAHQEGLIFTSACLKGEVAQNLMAQRFDKAREAAVAMRDMVGENNYFLEIQENGVGEQQLVNDGMWQLGAELGLGVVATCDVHYLEPEDKKAQDVLVCINTGKKLADPNRLKLDATLHFRSRQEMSEVFAGRESALQTSVDIAERCCVEFPTGARHVPIYTPEKTPAGDDQDPTEFFETICAAGLADRYGTPVPEAARERYKLELDVIVSMGFVSYFLIVWDFIRWAKEQGIPVGPGRGSAAGSIIAYALGITEIDPLKYGLLFERFLNKQRVSMPDIDVDLCQERRGEVIDYVRTKYGRDAVAQIITFGTLASRSVIRDVGRVLDIPLADVDRVAKLVPADLTVKRKKLGHALKEVPELRDAIDADPRFEELFAIAQRLEGSVRNASTHACGVVIGDGPLIERVPLYRDTKNPNDICTQFSMGLLEDSCGLLKMDFLGLRTLTVIHWANKHIETLTGTSQPLTAEALHLDDASGHDDAEKTYALLQRGDTKGVFQFESEGYRSLLQRLQPDCFADIIALGAMYRPGPLGAGMVDAYVNRKHGRERVTYAHPALATILGETYGCLIYQEQVMQIAHTLGGLSLNDADSLRKAMGKKKPKVMARFRERFVGGAKDNGCPEAVAAKIWEQMEHFAGYGFNKSHAAAYAFVTYQTAWLKANYPVAFMAALLSSETNNIDKLVAYIAECEHLGIRVLAPSVNHSAARFSVVETEGQRQISYGLAALRGVGESAAQSIVDARERCGSFRDLFHFCSEVDTKVINKATIELLAKSGALDCFGGHRAQLAAAAEGALAHGQQVASDRRVGQGSLFGDLTASASTCAPSPPQTTRWLEQQLLQFEKEALGFYLSGHPIKAHAKSLKFITTATTSSLVPGAQAVIGCVIANLRTRVDKRGNTMAFVELEDPYGAVDSIVFGKVYTQVRDQLIPDVPIVVAGSVDEGRMGPQLIVDKVAPLEQAFAELASHLCLKIDHATATDANLAQLAKLLSQHHGTMPVFCDTESERGHWVRIRMGEPLAITPTLACLEGLAQLLGDGAVRLVWVKAERAAKVSGSRY